jgi:hypothetical protein
VAVAKVVAPLAAMVLDMVPKKKSLIVVRYRTGEACWITKVPVGQDREALELEDENCVELMEEDRDVPLDDVVMVDEDADDVWELDLEELSTGLVRATELDDEKDELLNEDEETPELLRNPELTVEDAELLLCRLENVLPTVLDEL